MSILNNWFEKKKWIDIKISKWMLYSAFDFSLWIISTYIWINWVFGLHIHASETFPCEIKFIRRSSNPWIALNSTVESWNIHLRQLTRKKTSFYTRSHHKWLINKIFNTITTPWTHSNLHINPKLLYALISTVEINTFQSIFFMTNECVMFRSLLCASI